MATFYLHPANDLRISSYNFHLWSRYVRKCEATLMNTVMIVKLTQKVARKGLAKS